MSRKKKQVEWNSATSTVTQKTEDSSTTSIFTTVNAQKYLLEKTPQHKWKDRDKAVAHAQMSWSLITHTSASI